MPGQGKSLTIAEKELVLRVKAYFEEERKNCPADSRLDLPRSVSLTSACTGFSEVTVERIIAEFNKQGAFSAPKPPIQK